MYFCSSFLCGNRNYSSFCCERLWFKTWTWLFKIWVCSLSPPDPIHIVFLYNIHIHMPGFVCLGGWMVVRSFPSYSTLPSGHTSLPPASSWAKVIVWLGHCQDQIRQQDCKKSSHLLVCAGLFSSDVMSHLIHASVEHRREEEGCDLGMCGWGF